MQQTQKELTEANDLLIKMRIELNTWKMDVLSFRDEMRQAEEAELEALLKILRLLGGQVTIESAQSENEGSDSISPTESARPQSQETPDLGQRNG